jgi:hypothetical protein
MVAAMHASHRALGARPTGHSGRLRPVAVLAFLALLALAAAQDSPRLTGHIVDEAGAPLAASVAIADAQGKTVEIEGEHPHVRYLGKRWCYADGRFAAPAAGGVTVEIRRGLETLPLKETVSPGARTFRLKRWISMSGAGYLSGDTHVHFLDLGQCHLQMRAEDLQVLNLLTSDFTNDVHKFTGKLDPISTPGHWVYVGQEFRDWQQGHLNMLRLRKIVQPLEPFGGNFRDVANRHLLLKPAAEAARKQGAAVTWAHFGDMPGAESPIGIAMGLIDAVDLITQVDPLRTGLHWQPWRMPRPAHLPELPALAAIDLYYQYLNAGFRLPLASGTDKMGDDIPVGSSRMYVKTKESSYDAWIAGLKEGNGFITNAPLLTFEVDGHSSGAAVRFRGTRMVTARAVARSVLPFTQLQVMVNGNAVASSEEPSRDESGVYQASVEARIGLDRSAWIAARVAEPKVEGKAILPRRMTVFAHSNPVYFLRDGKKVRLQESIDYLTLYLKYTEHWFATAARFESEGKRQEAVGAARSALALYGKL